MLRIWSMWPNLNKLNMKKTVKNKNVIVINPTKEIVISQESKDFLINIFDTGETLCCDWKCTNPECRKFRKLFKEVGGKKIERKKKKQVRPKASGRKSKSVRRRVKSKR